MAKVLSTMSGTPASWAMSATASTSNTSPFGLPIISAKTAFVFGPMALRKFSGSDGSTNLVVIPSLGKRMLEQVLRSAVKLRRGHDFVSGFGDGENRVANGGLPDARPKPRRRPPARRHAVQIRPSSDS